MYLWDFYRRYLFFATSVEGIGIYKNCWQFLIDRTKGPGIQNYKMCIYSGNIDDGFRVIYSQRKTGYLLVFNLVHFNSPQALIGVIS